MDDNTHSSREELVSSVIEKANYFINTLHPPQKDLSPANEYALFPFDHKNRESFDYFAPSSQFTRGLPLRYMNPRQKEAALELLKVSLSDEGFNKVEQIFLLEDVLLIREQQNPLYIRDSKAYYIAVFGIPAKTGAWSWRIQGHHLSLQWTFLNGEIISSTPQFLGAQPMKIKTGDSTDIKLPVGTRVLGQEEDLARDLIESLSADQQLIARGQVQWDLETTNSSDALEDRKPNRLEDNGNGLRGLLYSSLIDENKREKLQRLVKSHTRVQTSIIAKDRLDKIEKEGWDHVRFFFMNGFERGDPLYYRIRSNTFLIEYVNKAFSSPSEPADHQHTVWRDFNNDWGRDKLLNTQPVYATK